MDPTSQKYNWLFLLECIFGGQSELIERPPFQTIDENFFLKEKGGIGTKFLMDLVDGVLHVLEVVGVNVC